MCEREYRQGRHQMRTHPAFQDSATAIRFPSTVVVACSSSSELRDFPLELSDQKWRRKIPTNWPWMVYVHQLISVC